MIKFKLKVLLARSVPWYSQIARAYSDETIGSSLLWTMLAFSCYRYTIQSHIVKTMDGFSLDGLASFKHEEKDLLG